MQIIAGKTDVSISIYARALSGAPLTGKVAADFALTYRRAGANVALSLSDLASIDAAHTDGGLYEVGNGEYRLDLPDAAVAAGATQLTINGTVAGGVILGYPIALDTATVPAGVHPCTWTVTDGTDPLENATVTFWLGGVLKGTGVSDVDGHVPMSLDAATYDVAIVCDGYTFAATTHTVSATAATWTHSFAMTAPSITPSPLGQTTLWATVYDEDGDPEEDVTITCRMVTAATGTGSIFDFAIRSETSDAAGLVEFTKCVQGAVYQVRRGKHVVDVTVGTAPTQGVGNFGGCDG
jgi:hypothetical protein